MVSSRRRATLVSRGFHSGRLFVTSNRRECRATLGFHGGVHRRGPSIRGTPCSCIVVVLASVGSGKVLIFPARHVIGGVPSFSRGVLINYLSRSFAISGVCFARKSCTRVVARQVSSILGKGYFTLCANGNCCCEFRLGGAETVSDCVASGSRTCGGLSIALLRALILREFLNVSRDGVTGRGGLFCAESTSRTVRTIRGNRCRYSFLVGTARIRSVGSVSLTGRGVPRGSACF